MNGINIIIFKLTYFRKSILSILCWCLPLVITAQTSLLDSLEQALASAKENSWERGNLLMDISQEISMTDSAKSRSYIMEALDIAQKKGFKTIETRAYCGLGLYHFLAGQIYFAHANYRKAEKICIEMDDKPYLCIVYYNMTILFNAIDDKENTVFYADKLLETASELYNLTTLKPLNNLPDTITVGYQRIDFPSLIFGAQFCKGAMLFKGVEDREALDFYLDMYHKSILLTDDNLNLQHHFSVLCGNLYNKLEQPREALKYLHGVRANFEEKPGNEKLAFMPATYIYLAESYALLHRLDSADYYSKKSWDVSLTYADGDDKLRMYHTQSLIDSIKGDFRNALGNFKSFHHLSDSVAKAGKTAEITRLKNWNELEQKDNENEILQSEKQKQHKLILVLAGALVVILALLALAVYYYRKTTEKNREMKELHAVKDKLFSVVAHDLRSPMGALMSVLRLANRNMIDADTQVQLLKDISGRVDDIYGLIDNLLRWAKSQMQGIVPSPAYFDVQEASRAVTDSLQSIAAGKKINLSNSIQPRQVYADCDMFAVVVRNLTMNAIKYTSAEEEVTLSSELSDNKLVISVKDTGIGMTQDVQKKLFNLSETKSQRGTNNESGTGLGLVLCSDFVKANGGSIRFTSAQGKGTTFCFSVPVEGDEKRFEKD